jgi:hypothetical protein
MTDFFEKVKKLNQDPAYIRDTLDRLEKANKAKEARKAQFKLGPPVIIKSGPVRMVPPQYRKGGSHSR